LLSSMSGIYAEFYVNISTITTLAELTCRWTKDPPETRIIEPPDKGTIVAIPRLGGLHHRYVRIAVWWRWQKTNEKTIRLYFQEGQVRVEWH